MRSLYKLSLPSFDVINFTSNKMKLKKYSSLFLNKKKIPHFCLWNSQPRVFSFFLFKRVGVHNGRFFVMFQIRRSMFYTKFGDLVRTKRLGSSIHVVKKKKK